MSTSRTPTPHAHSPRHLVGVWLGLLALTALTVGAAGLELGAWDLVFALGIASAKAALVALEYMHLREDNGLYAGALIGSVLLVLLLVYLTSLDQAELLPSLVGGADAPS